MYFFYTKFMTLGSLSVELMSAKLLVRTFECKLLDVDI